MSQNATIKDHQAHAAGTFTKRVGSTIYQVGVHFSKSTTETINDKIARLTKNEGGGKAVND